MMIHIDKEEDYNSWIKYPRHGSCWRVARSAKYGRFFVRHEHAPYVNRIMPECTFIIKPDYFRQDLVEHIEKYKVNNNIWQHYRIPASLLYMLLKEK